MSWPRLFSFCSFIPLFTGAKSTRWPGASRFAIHILCFCMLVAIAQFGINFTLGIVLLHIGNNVMCQVHDETLGFEDDAGILPVTFANIEATLREMQRWDYLSMHENKGKAEISIASFVTPLLIIAIMLAHISLHFRGISNRAGMLFAISLISLFSLTSAQDHWLDIDANKLHMEYSWCWKSSEDMKELWTEGMGRWRLVVAGEVLSGVGGLCSAAYFALAIAAATANRSSSQRQSTRLQNLRFNDDPNSHTNFDGHTHGSGLPSTHLSPSPSTRIPAPPSSSSNTPANKSHVKTPPTAAKPEESITEAEKREREHGGHS